MSDKNPRAEAAKLLKGITAPSGDVASIPSLGGWIDKDGVINFGTKAPSKSGVPSLTEEQKASWLEMNLKPPTKADLYNKEYQESDAIEKKRLLLPEGKGGWDPARASSVNPAGAYGDRDWWIKHGDPAGTDGLGDGTWETGPSEADAWAYKPIGDTKRIISGPLDDWSPVEKAVIKIQKGKKNNLKKEKK